MEIDVEKRGRIKNFNFMIELNGIELFPSIFLNLSINFIKPIRIQIYSTKLNKRIILIYRTNVTSQDVYMQLYRKIYLKRSQRYYLIYLVVAL